MPKNRSKKYKNSIRKKFENLTAKNKSGKTLKVDFCCKTKILNIVPGMIFRTLSDMQISQIIVDQLAHPVGLFG